jgi:hypothetical protein
MLGWGLLLTPGTVGFTKSPQNHAHAVAVYLNHYNFVRIHKILRVTPAMQAGLLDHVWSLEEMLGLLGRLSAVAA